MNVFILTDMEGISGVNSIDCMDRQNQPYQESRKRLTEELIFAAEVCRKNGAEQIYFLDGHGGGGNILPELIPQWLQQSTLAQWQQLLQDGAVDCQIEIGSHARAGTVGGFLDHTISSGNVYRHCINGREYGELGLHAILCGRYNIPIVFCSGDEAACTQAKEYIPDIYTSAVKVAEVRNTAISYPDAKERIAAGITSALQNYQSVKPHEIDLPATVTITYYRTDMCEKVLARCGDDVTRTDARTLSKTIFSVNSYYDLRF